MPGAMQARSSTGLSDVMGLDSETPREANLSSPQRSRETEDRLRFWCLSQRASVHSNQIGFRGRSMVLTVASPLDAPAIASLHAESWRNAYRGMLPDQYLDEQVVEDRREFWCRRFSAAVPERRLIMKAADEATLLGFVCVLLDEEPAWGARLDNLHVMPAYKGRGVGYALFRASREWVARMTPTGRMHLWCVERNYVARRFYDRQDGRVVERDVRPVAQALSVPELRYVWGPLHLRPRLPSDDPQVVLPPS